MSYLNTIYKTEVDCALTALLQSDTKISLIFGGCTIHQLDLEKDSILDGYTENIDPAVALMFYDDRTTVIHNIIDIPITINKRQYQYSQVYEVTNYVIQILDAKYGNKCVNNRNNLNQLYSYNGGEFSFETYHVFIMYSQNP